MLFKNWILRNLTDGHMVGRQRELGTMIRSDDNFPMVNDCAVISRYINSNEELQEYAGTPFRILWSNFIRDENTGANRDMITKDRYKDMLSCFWTGFKRAMRYDDIAKRMHEWDEAEEYFNEHMAVDAPEFAAEIMTAFKNEIVRDAEREPITDIRQIVE